MAQANAHNERDLGGDRATTAAQMSARERAAQALHLRSLRWKYADIARELGYRTTSAAFKACERAMKEITKEPAEALLRQELESLDVIEREALSVLLDVSASGKRPSPGVRLRAIDRVLRVKKQRAEYTGIADLRAKGPDMSAVAASLGALVAASVEYAQQVDADQLRREAAEGIGVQPGPAVEAAEAEERARAARAARRARRAAKAAAEVGEAGQG